MTDKLNKQKKGYKIKNRGNLQITMLFKLVRFRSSFRSTLDNSLTPAFDKNIIFSIFFF